MAGLAAASARVHTLTIGAAVLALGISFALVAGAVGALKFASASSMESALAVLTPEEEARPQSVADIYSGSATPSPQSPAAGAAVTPAGATVPPAAGSELSRAQAIALVQGRYRARVVRTTLAQDKGGRRLYVFRLLSGSGKVWTVRIDAQTGAEVP
jgi:peptidase YpeB-like protein